MQGVEVLAAALYSVSVKPTPIVMRVSALDLLRTLQMNMLFSK